MSRQQDHEKRLIEFNKANVFCAKSKKGYGNSYFAKRNIRKGEIVFKCHGKIINHQTSCNSMQIDFQKHYIPKKWTGKYLNHSCLPNLHIKTRADGYHDLIALKDIKKGEEINYSYYMSEYEWSKIAKENYVDCMCQSKNCNGKIRSFSDVTNKERNVLKKNKFIAKYLHNI